jgi:hypothetical protein
MMRALLRAVICLAMMTSPLFSQTSEVSGPALVRAWYRQYFHREPEPRSVAVWSYLFSLGNSREAVLARMLSTDEYFRSAGGTAEGLVAGWFEDGAANEPSPEARNAWAERARSLDRQSLATQFVQAHPEALRPKSGTSALVVAERQRSRAVARAAAPARALASTTARRRPGSRQQ